MLKKNCLLMILLLFFESICRLGYCQTMAPTKTVSQNSLSNPVYQTYGVQTLPNGYIPMITNFYSVENKMIEDIRNEHGQMWREWMNEGLLKNNSLYWWLLSEWFYQNHQNDQSYMAAVQAVVFSRMDLAGCDGLDKKSAQSVLDQLMYAHKDIANIHPSQNIVSQSVLNSVMRAQKMLDNGEATSGMLCFMSKIKNANQTNKNRKTPLQISIINKQKEHGLIMAQRSELKKIKIDFSYNQIWKKSDMNRVWSANKNNK